MTPRSTRRRATEVAGATEVTGLAMDSRAVKPGDLFFALAGLKTDGARFIDSAIASGAVAVAGDHPPPGERRVPFVADAQSAPRAGAGRGEILFPAAIDDRGRHRHQRQDLGRRLHAPDLAAARSCRGQHRHHRAGVAEAHRLRLADDAGSDRAAPAARRNRPRRRHPSRVRGVLARARSVSARRRAHQCRRLHQPVARPHGLPSRRRALSGRQAPAVPRSRRRRWCGGDLGRS